MNEEMFKVVFGSATFASTLRLAAPLILAALGGAFTKHADIFNIALEGYMLISAFFGAWGCIVFGNPWMGLLAAIVSATLMSSLFALLVLKMNANNSVVGLAINLAMTGLSTWLLDAIFHQRGWVIIEKGGFPSINIPVLCNIPYLSGVLSNQNLLVYFTFIVALIAEWFLYQNIYGIRLRAVGEHSEAAESVGIPFMRYKIWSVLMSGVLCGCSGAFLSLGGASMFSEGMSSGKGAIALGIVHFSGGRPLLILLGSLVFGYADAVSVALQQFGFPNQAMMTIPFLMVILVLAVVGALSRRPLYRRLPWLAKLLGRGKPVKAAEPA